MHNGWNGKSILSPNKFGSLIGFTQRLYVPTNFLRCYQALFEQEVSAFAYGFAKLRRFFLNTPWLPPQI